MSDFTSRPATKRIRSDQDHSKGHVKDRENTKQKAEKKKQGEADESGDEDDKEKKQDEDWIKQAPFQEGASWDDWKTKWRQSCWCGKTAFVFCEDPVSVKYCHCEDCQRLHGAPFQMAAIFKKEHVRLDSSGEWLGFMSAHGEVHPLSKTPTPLPRKTSCRACGSPLFDEGRNMCIAFPPTFEFARSAVEKEKAHETEDGQSKLEQKEHDEKSNTDENCKESRHGKGKAGTEKVGLPDAFKPTMHIFYERRVMDIVDGLPKYRKHHKDDEGEMGETERP